MRPAHTIAATRLVNDTWGELTRETYDELCTTA
ncbi:MAG: hypothetical protein JWM72_918 [Actinomycetia bacterium]|jgi:hypothetical protein|nr:hypothetical protein [Actinomycetes bacterium]MDQ1460166.1 hypothetical protein [Actinomycetota bacterium]